MGNQLKLPSKNSPPHLSCKTFLEVKDLQNWSKDKFLALGFHSATSQSQVHLQQHYNLKPVSPCSPCCIPAFSFPVPLCKQNYLHDFGGKKNYMTKLMREKRKGYFSSGQAAMVHSQTYKPCPSAAEEWLKAAYSIHSHPKELKNARRKVSLPTILNSPTILIEIHYLNWADNVQKFIRLHSKCTRKKYIETDSFRCGVTQKNSCDVYYYCS